MLPSIRELVNGSYLWNNIARVERKIQLKLYKTYNKEKTYVKITNNACIAPGKPFAKATAVRWTPRMAYKEPGTANFVTSYMNG